MTEYIVAKDGDLADREHITVQLEGREITIFYKDGAYYAYTNWCPHQSGPVCEGMISGTWDATFDKATLNVDFEWGREGEILNCPWHGWEFELETGKCLSQNVKLISHSVTEKEDDIVVTL